MITLIIITTIILVVVIIIIIVVVVVVVVAATLVIVIKIGSAPALAAPALRGALGHLWPHRRREGGLAWFGIITHSMHYHYYYYYY